MVFWRVHLFEIHDMEWTPVFLRGYVTDVLAMLWSLCPLPNLPKMFGLPFAATCADRLEAALRRTGERHVLDLCSGSGGPLPQIQKILSKRGMRISIKLTDLVPNVEQYERLKQAADCTPSEFSYSVKSVDATNCSERGFRTLFACFHHFEPVMAKKVIQDAIDSNSGIAIFEGTERSLFNLLIFFPIIMPIVTMLFAWKIQPFDWRRLFLCWGIPLLPWITGFDGWISCLRTYSRPEMMKMIAQLNGADGYDWQIGVDHYLVGPNCVYYIGTPRVKTK